ncbi:MAG: helix-turn-helix domain-containing protein [Calditrichaeota bacterium]|nr:helix-turn-helix domain-containing protein [Calditrichota bacterium]
MNKSEQRLLIPLKEVASMLSMCRQTVMEHVKKGQLACIKLGKNSVYFTEEDLDEFIKKHRVKCNPTRIPELSDQQ